MNYSQCMVPTLLPLLLLLAVRYQMLVTRIKCRRASRKGWQPNRVSVVFSRAFHRFFNIPRSSYAACHADMRTELRNKLQGQADSIHSFLPAAVGRTPTTPYPDPFQNSLCPGCAHENLKMYCPASRDRFCCPVANLRSVRAAHEITS